MRIVNNELGNPDFELQDSTRRIAEGRGITNFHLSMSHDAGIAIAYVIAESVGRAAQEPAPVMREAVISTGAITENVQTLRAAIGPVDALAVVKANGYGHGAIQSARAAIEGGATWLGVVDLGEALELRQAGLTVPILTWLHDPGEDFAAAVEHTIDVGVSSIEQVDAAASAGATVHLKVDTGLSRNGAVETEWPEFFAAAARHQAAGRLVVRGLWSHLANTDQDAAQVATFHRAHGMARDAGLDPEVLHIAATGGALQLPESRLTLVRLGISMYGLGVERSVHDALTRRLRPAMELAASVASVKRVPAGSGVSYGHDYVTSAETSLALIPLGYGDGIPRHASSSGPISINGTRYVIAGRVAMDQVIVDVGDDPVLGRRPSRAVRRPGDRGAERRGLGRRGRHHRLRDRHPHRPASPAQVRAVTGDLVETRLIVETPDAMEALGATIARQVDAGDLILLNGELGAGKTTLTRGLGRRARRAGRGDEPHVRARAHASTCGGVASARSRRRLSARVGGRAR